MIDDATANAADTEEIRDLAHDVRSYLRKQATTAAPAERDVLDRAVVVLHVAGSPRVSVPLPRCPHRVLVIGDGDIPSEWQLPTDDTVVDARRNIIGWQGLPYVMCELGEWLAYGATSHVM